MSGPRTLIYLIRRTMIRTQPTNGADRFRQQFRCLHVQPELLRFVKRGKKQNCQRAVRSRRLILGRETS